MALPIFLTDAQINTGGQTLIFLSLAFFSCFLTYCVLMALYKRSAQNILNDRIDAERFIRNFHLLFHHLFLADLNLKRMISGHSLRKLVHFVWLILLLIAAITLQVGLLSISPNSGNYTAVQAGLIFYFISLIGYFVTRSFSYYNEKLQVLKRVWIHAR